MLTFYMTLYFPRLLSNELFDHTLDRTFIRSEILLLFQFPMYFPGDNIDILASSCWPSLRSCFPCQQDRAIPQLYSSPNAAHLRSVGLRHENSSVSPPILCRVRRSQITK